MVGRIGGLGRVVGDVGFSCPFRVSGQRALVDEPAVPDQEIAPFRQKDLRPDSRPFEFPMQIRRKLGGPALAVRFQNNTAIASVERPNGARPVRTGIVGERACVGVGVLQRDPARRQIRQTRLGADIGIVRMGRLIAAASEGQRLKRNRRLLENVGEKVAHEAIEA